MPPMDSDWLNYRFGGTVDDSDWTGTEPPWPFEQHISAHDYLVTSDSPTENPADSLMRIDTPQREESPLPSAITATSETPAEVDVTAAMEAFPVAPSEMHHNVPTITTVVPAGTCVDVEKHHMELDQSKSIRPGEEDGPKTDTDNAAVFPTSSASVPVLWKQDDHNDNHNKLMGELDKEADEGLADEELLRLATKYELRPAARWPDQTFMTTWVDEDKTGNYDPSEEHRRVRSKRHYLRPQRKREIELETDLDHSELPHAEEKVRILRRLIVELKFWGEAVRTAVQASLSKPSAYAHFEHDDFSEGYRLRRKQVHRPTTDYDCLHRDGDGDNQIICEDLTGHPEARGCRGCLHLGIRCPLLDDEYGWPCHTCRDDETDCELVIEPASKRGCENCRRGRISCSFNYQTDNQGPCQDCEEDGRHCIAGPARDAIRPRLRYERDWTASLLPVKKPVKGRTRLTCAQCCEANRECSFSTGAPGCECIACEMEGNICVVMEETVSPAALAPKPAVQKQTVKRDSVREHDASAERAKKQQQPQSRRESMVAPFEAPQAKIKTKKITTRFSHPIIFNSEAAAGAPACNFCDESFAILGLEPREAEVIERKDGGGFIEVQGGYHSEGWPNTAMCTNCSMRRMNIACCPGHSLRLTNGKLSADSTNAINALFQGTIREKDRWCCICPAIASYECQAAGCMDAYGRPKNGCGMRICETCMMELTGLHDGNLHGMLTSLKDGPSDQRPLGLRADAEFLRADGLLVQHLMKMV